MKNKVTRYRLNSNTLQQTINPKTLSFLYIYIIQLATQRLELKSTAYSAEYCKLTPIKHAIL